MTDTSVVAGPQEDRDEEYQVRDPLIPVDPAAAGQPIPIIAVGPGAGQPAGRPIPPTVTASSQPASAMPASAGPAVTQPQPMAPPIMAGPTPSAPSIVAGPAPKPPRPPASVYEAGLSDVQKQNPFAVANAAASAIHNPFLRILAKVGAHAGAGLEGLSKDYPAIQAERVREAEEPSAVAGKQAETAKTQAETQAITNPKPKMTEITGAAGPNGETLFRNENNPNAGPSILGPNGFQPLTVGPAGPARTASTTGGGAVAAPAGGPAPVAAPVAGPQPGIVRNKPPEPQRAPLATPEEQAKLAQVGTDSDTYNKQIKDILGDKAGDFPVAPTDSRERADKILADARAEAEAEDRKTNEARGAANEARQNENEDIKPVQATNKDGQTIITNFGDARKNGMTDVLPVTEAEIQTARQTVTNVNLMEQALKQLHENVDDIDALTQKDKTILQEFLNSHEMNPTGGALNYISGSLGQSLNSYLQSDFKAQGLTEPAKNILRNIVNLRESSLGLGKLETGGSRATQSAIDAINATIPGTFITNATDADDELKKFADRLDEIKAEAPVIKGHAFRDNPFKAAEPQHPDVPIPGGWTWTTQGGKTGITDGKSFRPYTGE